MTKKHVCNFIFYFFVVVVLCVANNKVCYQFCYPFKLDILIVVYPIFLFNYVFPFVRLIVASSSLHLKQYPIPFTPYKLDKPCLVSGILDTSRLNLALVDNKFGCNPTTNNSIYPKQIQNLNPDNVNYEMLNLINLIFSLNPFIINIFGLNFFFFFSL